MDLSQGSVVVTGGASGLGRATAQRLAQHAGGVTIIDLPTSAGQEVADSLGPTVQFAPADVTDPAAVASALDAAERQGPLRALVHCAGRGGTVRVVDRDGSPGDLDLYESIVRLNLVGSFLVLSQAAARMAAHDPVQEERGVCVLTSSVAAYEGQVGQLPYASAKAGIVGLTLVAARDLANRQIRVVSIAPGIFDTPILDRLGDELKAGLGRQVPHPARLGRAEEFAMLAEHIVANPYLNGETIRLDGGVRMAPR
jgi:NAD(P)-dependent dehydrogenase (short-subunit alcohol dehydrogenase family)